MYTCTFCPRVAPGRWALTVCNGDPESTESWRREIVPVCYRCLDLLGPAGGSGRVLKATGERWFSGHTTGRFKATGQVREWSFSDGERDGSKPPS